jgi:hypothetical protein
LLLGNALNIKEKYIQRKFKKYGPDIRFVIQINAEDANYTINEAIAKFDGKVNIGALTKNYNTESESIFEHHFTKLDDVKEVSYSSCLIQDMFNNCTDPKMLYNMGKNFPGFD